MEQIKELLAKAWQKYLDDYEENPRWYEEPLIVKVSHDLKEAVVYESDMSVFINRNKNFIFNLEFDAGKPTNLDAIAEEISTKTLK